MSMKQMKKMFRDYEVIFESPVVGKYKQTLEMRGKIGESTINLMFWSPTKSPYTTSYYYSFSVERQNGELLSISGRLQNFAMVFPEFFESHFIIWAEKMAESGFEEHREMVPLPYMW